MAYGLPARDEADWDVKLNASVDAVKATADSALANAATAQSTANTAVTNAATAQSGADASAKKASNLSDLASASTARANLGLGDSATKNAGVANGTATLDASALLPEAQVPTRLTQTQLDARARRLLLSGETLTSVQTWLNAIASGDVAHLIGSISISGALTVPAGVTLDLSAATITQTTATGSTLILSDGSKVKGGTITGPASWNTTTTGDFTEAVVYVPANSNNCEIGGVTINNVYRVGIGVKGDYARIHNCQVEGNLPAGYYTGTETSHFAVKIDPSGTSVDGASVVADNIIGGCVQGVMIANFGTGVGRGVVVSGNLFHDCWNHGIYQSHGNGMTFAGNTFQRCQKGIVATGQGTVVSGNSMWTNQTGDQRDIVGISLRNASDSIVSDNTIIGDGSSTATAINLDNTLGGTSIVRNLVANNTIKLTGSTSATAISIGSSTDTTTLTENRVVGNVITAPGPGGPLALIEVTLATGSTGYGNVVEGNTITITGGSHAIQVTNQRFGVIANNYVRLAYSAGAGLTLIMARLTTSTHCHIHGNTWACSTSDGGNITVQGVREMDATCDNNRLGPNLGRWQTGILVASTAVVQANAANGSVVVSVVGEYASATALGALNGKVAAYDDKGTLLGYVPLYATIT